MPGCLKTLINILTLLVLFCSPGGAEPPTTLSDGISHYYVRYDIKSSKNKLMDEQLTMVPATDEFRGEKFSPSRMSHVISAAPGESPQRLYFLAKQQALEWVLEKKGLKSVKAFNQDTIVSYEGMIITPVSIESLTYDPDLGGYSYTARIQFAPIAFPDQWETLQFQYRIREIFHDFIYWFK